MTFSLFRSITAVISLFVLTVSTVCAAPQTAEYLHYTAPQGTNYFAVGLQAPLITADKPAEVVFLADTSASQLGQARLDTMAAIVSAINDLPEGTLIQIFAMDVDTEALTASFAKKGSPEIEAALKTLNKRIPLGATDFAKGLQTVRKAFDGQDTAAPKSVLYFGDGRSMAKTISPSLFKKETELFREQHIPFTACSVGVQTNFGFIAAFASQTGGNLITLTADGKDTSAAEKTGKELAKSATATVVYPETGGINFPAGVAVYPSGLLPVRSDRATILVGKTDNEELPEFTLNLRGNTIQKNVQLSYNVVPNKAKTGNNFLKTIVETAAKDDGLTMPIAGWEILNTLEELFYANIANQVDKAQASVETGNAGKALVILNSVLAMEPNNKKAQKLFEEAEKMKVSSAPSVRAIPSGALQDEIKAGVAQEGVKSSLPEQVDAVQKSQTVVLQKIQNEVKNAIIDAAKRTEKDPEGAVQGLKLMQQTVRSNTALVPGQRDALLDRLGNSLKQIERDQYIREYRSVQEESDAAKVRSRQEAIHQASKVRQKAVQVFDRFESLIEAEEYKPAITVAEQATKMLQDEGLPEITAGHAARLMSQLTYYISEYERLRYRRHMGFIDSFMEAEKSFVPMPDEPPISYIDRDRWALLTDYRRKKYSSVTLGDPEDYTKKVNEILDRRDIRLDIDENTTFQNLFDQIKNQLGTNAINFDLDMVTLQDEGEFSLESPVAPDGILADFTGRPFRSVLKRLLENNGLAFVIKPQDEVVLITTQEQARDPKNLNTLIYPVGDIVFAQGGSVSSSSSGMGGGMMGGMGGGMGGMGGGMGGMGGGMGGMGGGMGGMGGGMMSVPNEVKRSTASQAQSLLNEALKAENPDKFWTDYFSSDKVNDEIVKEVVGRLVKRLRNNQHLENQVIAITQTALLNGHGEPWMYEALTLALFLKGAPKQEILRAVLSAADFCDDPIDLLNIVNLMRSDLGLKREAFPLYQQALSFLPPKREFYAAALRLAEELYNEYGDEEPVEWIGLAILSQEWDSALGTKMVQDASDLLAAVKNKMEKSERREDAARLAKEIDDAKLRDCVVTVEWTGDANLDMMVREPTDSYCWFLSPRSTSGGLLKTHSSNPVSGNRNKSVKQLVYVCPKGFNGTYTLVLQKEWGTPANNLVKISVDTNVVPGEKQQAGKAYALTSDGIFVNFKLDSGRRTESVSEGQLAEADLQASLAQQVTNRNRLLQRLQDDGVLSQFMTGDPGTTGGGGSDGGSTGGTTGNNGTGGSGSATGGGTGTTGGGLRQRANARRMDSQGRGALEIEESPFDAIVQKWDLDNGKVGYQPEIEWMDSGSMLMSEAVTTPDRCYVLLRPYPMFQSSGSGGGGYGSSGGMSGSSGSRGGSSGGSRGGGGRSF